MQTIFKLTDETLVDTTRSNNTSLCICVNVLGWTISSICHRLCICWFRYRMAGKLTTLSPSDLMIRLIDIGRPSQFNLSKNAKCNDGHVHGSCSIWCRSNRITIRSYCFCQISHIEVLSIFYNIYGFSSFYCIG